MTCLIKSAGAIYSMDISPDHQHIAYALEKKLIIYQLKMSEQSGRDLVGHLSIIKIVKYCPDGQFIASGSGDIFAKQADNSVRIWDLKTYTEFQILQGHDKQVCSLAFSTNQLVSGGKDFKIRIWGWKKGILLKQLYLGSIVQQLLYSPCGCYFVSICNMINIWNSLKECRILEYHQDAYFNTQVHYSNNGRLIVSQSSSNWTRILELNRGFCKAYLFTRNSYRVPHALSSDSKLLVVGSSSRKIHLWNILCMAKIIRIFKVPEYNVSTLKFCNSDKNIISQGWKQIYFTDLYFE